MKTQIEEAKKDFLQAKAGLLKALSTTTDDRLTWSPSETSRTPLQLAGHAAEVVGFLNNLFQGEPFSSTPQEADKAFRESEKAFTNRDEVIRTVEAKSDTYVQWLDVLDDEKFNSNITMPFGIGPVPLEIAITFPAFHMRGHQAQIDYVQTVYGDRDWHF